MDVQEFPNNMPKVGINSWGLYQGSVCKIAAVPRSANVPLVMKRQAKTRGKRPGKVSLVLKRETSKDPNRIITIVKMTV